MEGSSHPTLRAIPTWHEDNRPIVSHTNNNSLTSLISLVLTSAPEWARNWSLRLTRGDLEGRLKELPTEIDDILIKRLSEYRACSGEDNSLIRSINDTAERVLQCCRCQENPRKYILIDSFSRLARNLKSNCALEDIWKRLSHRTKVLCNGVAPYSLPPGSFASIDLNTHNPENVTNTIQHVVVTGEKLRYRVEFQTRDLDSLTYSAEEEHEYEHETGHKDVHANIPEDVRLVYWTEVKALSDNMPPEMKKRHKELLEAIAAAQKTSPLGLKFHSPEEIEQKFSSERNRLQHRKYKAIQNYYQILFASLDIPVRLPIFIGNMSEYFIFTNSSATALKNHLEKCDVASQVNYAKQIATIFEREFYFGIKCLKSFSFEIRDDQLFACDLEESFIPLTLIQMQERTEQAILFLSEEYKRFPAFTEEFTAHIKNVFCKQRELSHNLVESLQELKKNHPEMIFFNKIISLAEICWRYDLPFGELLKAKEESPKRRNDLILMEVVKLLKQVPKKGTEIPTLRTQIDEVDSDFKIISEATFIENQLEQQADLERLIVADLVLLALESSASVEESFSETNLQRYFARYNPPENEPYFTKEDNVTSNYEYFELIFWFDFINNLSLKVEEINNNPANLALYYSQLPQEGKKYQEILYDKSLNYNLKRQGEAFLARIAHIKTFP